MAEESNGLASELTKVLKKNEELIGELRAKDRVIKQFEGVDLEALQAAADKLQEVEDAKKKEVGEYKTLYEQEIQKSGKLKNELESKGQQNVDLTKRLKVVEVMPDVFPEFREIAINQLSASVELGENGNATAAGKPLTDFMKEWAESPLGKRMTMAADNAGGGAQGSQGKSGPDPLLGAFKKGDPAYNVTEQAKLRKTDPERANKLAELASKG
jgi:hypothetical protein